LEGKNFRSKKREAGGNQMKYVIITADDFGLNSEVNEAVIQAHRMGILTSACLMVNAEGTEEAVLLAKKYPSLKVGLHLVLVDGFSVLSQKDIPGIVDETGKFSERMILSGIRYFFSKKNKRLLAKECEAQITKFLTTGINIDHLNSHKHLHIHPSISDILIPLVKKYHIPAVRLPWQGFNTLTPRQSGMAAAMLPWLIRLRYKLQQNKILHNQEIFGLYESGSMAEQSWLKLIPMIRKGITEIYCHPATRKMESAPDRYDHAGELAALLSPEVKESLKQGNVVLTCFSNISKIYGNLERIKG
jgi:chitin disaccharide deacetylase